MKLSTKRAAELRRQGVPVNMGQVVRPAVKTEPVKEPPPPKNEPPPAPVVVVETPNELPKLLEELTAVAKASEQNTAKILQLQADLAKPVPKRSWKCTIGRNAAGRMATVDIKET